QNGISYEEWLTENGFYDSYNVPLVEQTASIGTAVTILSENGGWLFQEYLRELADHTPGLLAVFWGLYLLIFNDWRYNKRPWRRGVIAMLAAWGLDLPLQRRLSRVCGITAMTLLLLGAVNLNMLVYETSYRGGVPLEAVWAIVTPAALLLLVCAVLIWRMQRLWTDFGAVAGQAAAVRAGELEGEIALQENSDLAGLADDLNHIRQGLHQAVEERTRSERMKVELVTNVSHDLKTPLTSIISYTELLSQEPLEPPASEYVQIMGEKAQRLKAMVQDVFEVSKAASGQLPVKLERLDYARLLRQTLADMAQAIDNSGLTLRTAIPEGEVPITADSDRLYRVFQNLIGNALKYSLPGSRVYLSLTVEGGQASAGVRNTSAAELKPGADYTARFVRGDESRTDGGSGLGLSIAESFTRACGGSLTISTEADLFTAVVTFPLAE
ncbi:MAG: HAMP domain-containing histidine kinase, partial [Lawsonibacter sp.]|nr:HAMP domain-containing histidine kinase [Lawsonibacter sp.]